MLISQFMQKFSKRRRPHSQPGSALAKCGELTFEDLVVVQTVAEQVVLATEQTFAMPGGQKKAIALKVGRDLLADHGLKVPDYILDTAIEASVRLLNLLERDRL